MARTAVDLLTGTPKPKTEPKAKTGPSSPEFQRVAQAPAPIRESACGWCGKIGGEIGKDCICTLANGPTPGGQFHPGRGPHRWQGKNGQWFRWFHHDCLDMFLGLMLNAPAGSKRCRRPGCPYIQHVDGIFCDDHWRQLTDELHDEIVFAIDEEDADRWKRAVLAAINHYLAIDGWLDGAA